MAKRRMLSIDLMESDDFIDMGKDAMLLYVYLNLYADDDGVVGNSNMVTKMVKVQKNKLELLIEKGYLIRLGSGIIVISHWHQHNLLRKDRYVQGRYKGELCDLKVVNGEYVLGDGSEAEQGNAPFFDNHSAPQDSIGKDSKEKDSKEKKREGKKNEGEYSEVEYSGDNGSRKKDSAEFSTPVCGKVDPGVPHFIKEPTEAAKKFSKDLTREEYFKYLELLAEMKQYFLSKGSEKEWERFFSYNEKRGWEGRDGENVLTNFYLYVDAWLDKKKEFFGDGGQK